VPETKQLNTDLDTDVIRRLKVYSALSGKTMRFLVNKWLGEKLDEKLPPRAMPRRLTESEATA
jgi:hypothetical protein